MTSEQSADLTLKAAALTQILAILEQLRGEAESGDDAVEWVIEQLGE